MKLKVSIVIPNYNGREILEKNLAGVMAAVTDTANNIHETIVVDDASTDDSVAFIKDNYPEIRLIKHRINRGFASSVNTGVRMAKGELVVLLNSDVFPSVRFLASTFRHFENENVFGVSLHEKGYGPARGVFKDGFVGHESIEESNQAKDTFWVSGGSGIFRRNGWIKLGGMDEKLLSPFYWEDLDLCYRAQKRGYVLIWEPKALVTHKHETTIGRLPQKYVDRIRERNQLIFIWKNLTSSRLFRKHLVGLTKRSILHPGYIRIVLMSLSKVGLILKARRAEAKEGKISDETIFQRFVRK